MTRAFDHSELPVLPRWQLVWFLCCRGLVVTLLLGGAIVFNVRVTPEAPSLLRSLFLLLGIYIGQLGIVVAAVARIRPRRLFVHAQLVWDLLFVAGLIYLTGCIDSPFHFLFFLVVIGASVFLGRREIFVVASAAAILFGSLLDLQYYGYLPQLPQWVAQAQQVDSRQVFFSVFVNVIGIFVTALLSGILAEGGRRSEQALEKKKIDYAELENLNRAILGNISSGLMIVNACGRIRSFNIAAENISGYALDEVYNRDVREIFPSFAVYDGTLRVVDRGEGEFDGRESGRRIFGYASSLVQGAAGNTLGLLITFRDMTWYKDIEERLQRSDRLAAVGQLASGMAHEIRNPLASISGSVQLLMEARNISEDDRRLMRIVVKEADRLSDLLTDFLHYAHPGSPKIDLIDVSAVLDELAVIAAADPRFALIEIRRVYPLGVIFAVDRRQLFQALWDLVINGAESMLDGGILVLGLIPDEGVIFVEDSGHGIPENIRKKIFDPFFTTKDRGTGLGLATVHAIVETHGGSVSVVRGQQGGSRFVIRLPLTPGAALA